MAILWANSRNFLFVSPVTRPGQIKEVCADARINKRHLLILSYYLIKVNNLKIKKSTNNHMSDATFTGAASLPRQYGGVVNKATR